MGEALIDKLYSFHFIFTWILAIIVAVNWCYIFKLALPEYSELLAPWAIYTVLVTFLMPFVKMSLLRMQQQDGWGRKMKICQTLLISTWLCKLDHHHEIKYNDQWKRPLPPLSD